MRTERSRERHTAEVGPTGEDHVDKVDRPAEPHAPERGLDEDRLSVTFLRRGKRCIDVAAGEPQSPRLDGLPHLRSQRRSSSRTLVVGSTPGSVMEGG
jgi:hypothetical protein